jgi:hypothetical protein
MKPRTPVKFYHIVQRRIPEDRTLHNKDLFIFFFSRNISSKVHTIAMSIFFYAKILQTLHFALITLTCSFPIFTTVEYYLGI